MPRLLAGSVVAAMLLMFSSFLPRANAQGSAQPTLAQQTKAGIDEMQRLYTPSTGLYQGTNWWPSANELTTLADYSLLTNSTSYSGIFANTLQLAPNQNAGFLDNFYDDEGWWALAWIAAYDVTKNPQYLTTAGSIFADMTGGWDSTCGGGIWWSKDRAYKNAIANELFLSVAAHLANRTAASDRAGYLSWANQEWAWFQGSGMINSQNLINDGLTTSTCTNNGQTTWTYNQGVVLGGLVELNQAQPAPVLMATANSIAQSAISHLTDSNGVLHDAGEPNLGADGPQFKGVFLRNLMALTSVSPQQQYADFALTNAESIWYTSRNANNAFGQVWTGPFDAVYTASQGSAVDAFVAALAASQNPSLNTLPDFTLTASPASFNLVPGGAAVATVMLTPENGFANTVELRASVVQAPAGVTASIASSTLTGSGQTTLNIDTTGQTPGGTLVVAVTGTSGGLIHTAYVQLLLPDFVLSTTASILYLNQGGSTSTAVAVNAINGFASQVALSVAGVPPLVSARFSPPAATGTSKLILAASVTAPTTSGAQITVSGTSGSTSHTAASLPVAISAGLGECGLGDIVNLSSSYNLTAIRSDGAAFTDGGIDSLGDALSGEVLTRNRVLNGIHFHMGEANVPNAVYGAGQVIALPHRRYQTLQLLGTGIQGTQMNQVVTITYTDGSTSQLLASFSDWFSPSVNVNEEEAIAMPYRNTSSGTADDRQFNVYGYTLLLDSSKPVKSMTLPLNRNVVVLAATLSELPLGKEVNLSSVYNATGITTDGTSTPSNGGVDGEGYTFSANALNDLGAGEEIVVGPSRFHLAAGNVSDVMYAAGQTVTLPAGVYTELKLLGTGVQGNQADQAFIVHYDDGSSETVHQSFSDWFSVSGNSNESVAVKLAYRNGSNGMAAGGPLNLYLYTFKLSPFKPIKSITLPVNRNVVVFSVTLVPLSAVDLETVICPVLDNFSGW
ncbi:glycoside hydrolase family 76 protein [Granulicella arctica]|uniref:glycoside hydrolase family 76 protein n=1 Tax=Granulicella arctica TaxID=940613 RepID=UPI0021DF4531|nr:glycoside hydrolase family 76 protein [Granulicella arctica]